MAAALVSIIQMHQDTELDASGEGAASAELQRGGQLTTSKLRVAGCAAHLLQGFFQGCLKGRCLCLSGLLLSLSLLQLSTAGSLCALLSAGLSSLRLRGCFHSRLLCCLCPCDLLQRSSGSSH